MFRLNNEQRKCFGLIPVKKDWECIVAKPGRHEHYTTYLYLDGNVIVKRVSTGDKYYVECELNEKVSDDKKYLMPKTSKGKSVLLSSSSIENRNGIGMTLTYGNDLIDLYNEKSQCAYYMNTYVKNCLSNIDGFSKWVEEWCNDTTEVDIKDIYNFSNNKRQHVEYKEGDVFRFKIDRRHYGYGRLILDYDKLKKANVPFWNVLAFKPLVCSVYHIVTERDDFSVEELKELKSLPSTHIADNSLFYGEFTIIGNIPIGENEDYPIMYGKSIRSGDNSICYQCGKTYRIIENGNLLYDGFRNDGIGFNLNLTLDMLQKCIDSNSNEPYWSSYYMHLVNEDLRNPKFSKELQEIREQFDIK